MRILQTARRAREFAGELLAQRSTLSTLAREALSKGAERLADKFGIGFDDVEFHLTEDELGMTPSFDIPEVQAPETAPEVIAEAEPVPTVVEVAPRDLETHAVAQPVAKPDPFREFAERLVRDRATSDEVPGVSRTDTSFRCNVSGCGVHASDYAATRRVGKREFSLLFVVPVRVQSGTPHLRAFVACFEHMKAVQAVADELGVRWYYRPLAECTVFNDPPVQVMKAEPKKKHQPRATKPKAAVPKSARCNCADEIGDPQALADSVPAFMPESFTTKEDMHRGFNDTAVYKALIEAHDGKEKARACPLHGQQMRALGTYRSRLVELAKPKGWLKEEPALGHVQPKSKGGRQEAPLPTCGTCGKERVKRRGHEQCHQCFKDAPKPKAVKAKGKDERKAAKQAAGGRGRK